MLKESLKSTGRDCMHPLLYKLILLNVTLALDRNTCGMHQLVHQVTTRCPTIPKAFSLLLL